MGLFDWIAKRREAAQQRETAVHQQVEDQKRQSSTNRDAETAEDQELANLLAEFEQIADSGPERERVSQRTQALKKLQSHASVVVNTYTLLKNGLRSEAERLTSASVVYQILSTAKILGPERAIEFICIAPFWESLISPDRTPFDAFKRYLSQPNPEHMENRYDNTIADIVPIDVRSVLEKLAASSNLDAIGPDWEETGVLLGYQPSKRAIGHEGEGNILTVAPPGSGKGQCHVLPNILTYDGPMVILDIKKSENFNVSKAASRSLIPSHLKGSEYLGHFPMYKFDPADADNSVIYNPLEFLPKSLDTLWAAAGRMAEWLCVPSTGSDTYFDDRARQWTRGLLAIMVMMSKDGQELPNVGQVADFVFGDTVEQNKFLANVDVLFEGTPLANVAKNIISTSERERSATMNTIARSLEPWQDPVIRRLTSGKSTWSPLSLLKPEKIGVSYFVCESPWDDAIAINICQYAEKFCYWFPRFFICMPAGDVRAATSVVRVLIGQHTDSLMERDHSRDDPPIIFMLDEFPQLGRMESIMRGVEMGRSAGLKFWFFAQDLQQIGRSYKPEDEAVILGSCVVQCFMNISTPETAQAVSQRLGTTRSVFAQTMRPLIPPEELLNSPKWKNKILCLRRQDEPLVLEKRMFKDML